MRIPTKDAARNKWYNILLGLGMSDKYLVNKHGPCPLCDGKDRFRWDNQDGRGTYYCSQCGSGEGLDLAIRYTNKTFGEVVKQIDLMIGNIQFDPKSNYSKPVNKDKIMESIKKVWNSKDSEIVLNKYLLDRGIHLEKDEMPKDIKGKDELLYINDDNDKHYIPAVVAAIRDEKGFPITIHRTYPDSPDGRKKKIMTPWKSYAGHCIKLYDPLDGVLGVAEGIETALAARICTGVPTWAAVSSHGMTKFNPPEGVHTLFIFGDSDESFTGQAAAYTLATRLKCRDKRNLTIHVVIPEKIGYDMLDILNTETATFNQVVDKMTGDKQ